MVFRVFGTIIEINDGLKKAKKFGKTKCDTLIPPDTLHGSQIST